MEKLITSIKVGSRFRKDMGDITGLAASIKEHGLLHPIVITPKGELIAGMRRIRAYKKLGKSRIAATVVDIEKLAKGEYAENVDRKDFTVSEAVAISDKVKEYEEEEARKRRGTRTDLHPEKFSPSSMGKSAVKAAKGTGRSHITLEKAKAVIKAAEKDEKYQPLADKLDKEGARVDAIYKELIQRQAREEYEKRIEKGGKIQDLGSLKKKFNVIYADPPWQLSASDAKGSSRGPERHYNVMTNDAIKKLPVRRLAADNCVLFLWVVSSMLPESLEVIKSWGFEYKTVGLVWVKRNRQGAGLFTGMGSWTRANVELCLLATRGKPLRVKNDVHQVIMAPVARHSEKPEEARKRIARLLVGPYLELFGRKKVEGWSVWGNEVK